MHAARGLPRGERRDSRIGVTTTTPSGRSRNERLAPRPDSRDRGLRIRRRRAKSFGLFEEELFRIARTSSANTNKGSLEHARLGRAVPARGLVRRRPLEASTRTRPKHAAGSWRRLGSRGFCTTPNSLGRRDMQVLVWKERNPRPCSRARARSEHGYTTPYRMSRVGVRHSGPAHYRGAVPACAAQEDIGTKRSGCAVRSSEGGPVGALRA